MIFLLALFLPFLAYAGSGINNSIVSSGGGGNGNATSIQNTAVSSSAPTTTSQCLAYSGTNWAPANCVAMGNSVGSGTSKSLLFVNGTGSLAQDNTNLKFDYSKYQLTVGNKIGLWLDDGTYFFSGDPLLMFDSSNVDFIHYNPTSHYFDFILANGGVMQLTSASALTPWTDGSGSLGVSSKHWGASYIDGITSNSGSISTSDSNGSVTLNNSIPTNGGHGVVCSDKNGGGNACKLEWISTNVNSGFGSNTQVWEVVSNGSEDSVVSPGTLAVGQDFAIVDASANPLGSGTHGAYRLAIEFNTGDWIVNPAYGTRNGLQDGVIKASAHTAPDSLPARNLTLHGGDQSGGSSGDAGDLILRGGVISNSGSGERGDVYLPSVAGTPSDTPHSHSGFVPVRYDTTNHKLCVYDSGWKCSGAFM